MPAVHGQSNGDSTAWPEAPLKTKIMQAMCVVGVSWEHLRQGMITNNCTVKTRVIKQGRHKGMMPLKRKWKMKMLAGMLALVGIVIVMFAVVKPEQEELTAEKARLFGETGYGREYFEFISKNMVSGGPQKDGIPAIDNPKYISKEQAEGILEDSDRIYGFLVDGVAKAIPQNILYWHEIVNDESDGERYSVSYCPLTGTVIGFQGKNLGVSGKLYNSNLVMYDRETGSEIPQILETAVNGPLQGRELENFYVYTTTWRQWKNAYPETVVLSQETGHPRDYNRSPYPGYDSLLSIWFPVAAKSDAFHSKKVIHGVFYKNAALAIPKEEFKGVGEAAYELGGESLVITYDHEMDVIKVHDSDGRQVNSYDVFWFAWYAYHPNTAVFTAP